MTPTWLNPTPQALPEIGRRGTGHACGSRVFPAGTSGLQAVKVGERYGAKALCRSRAKQEATAAPRGAALAREHSGSWRAEAGRHRPRASGRV